MRGKFSTTQLLVATTIFFIFSKTNQVFAQACPGLASITLTVVAAPDPAITAPAQICAGSTGTVAVTQVFSSYLWSNSATTQSISVNAPGDYTVTVTNSAGCTGTETVTIAPAPQPQPDIAPLAYACNGTLTLDAGAGFSSYSWTGGGSNQTANFTTNGTYSVTVTNAAGCTGTDNFLVNIPAPPVVAISGNAAPCDGTPTTLTATGGFSGYSWSNGGTSQSISVASAGSFSVTATDVNGCTDTDNFTVAIAPAPVPNLVGPAEICDGQSANFSVAGGPFSGYLWSNGGTTPTISTNLGGTISVTVTAANGCTGTDSQVLTVNPAPAPIIIADQYACNNQLTLDAGSGFSNYLWSNAALTQSISATANGNFSVTVTAANGCTGTDDFFVNIPTAPVVSISGDAQICDGESSVLTATAGFVAYLWNTGAVSNPILVFAPDNFSVTATDVFGCTATANFTVSGLASPDPEISGPSQICANGTATFSVPAGFSQYLWSNTATTTSISVNQAGNYSVTVTAANGCTGTDDQVLTISTSLQPNITELPYDCSGTVTLDAGAGFSTYLWSNGLATQTISATADGNFTVTVTEAGGCSGTATAFVSIPTAVVVSISGDGQICADETTELTATAGFDSYLWSNGQVGGNIFVNTPGNFSVIATDVFGCSETANFTVVGFASPVPVISGPSQICANGTATFSVPAGFLQYLWSNMATTASISVNQAGIYSITVTDANGCTGTDDQILTISTSLQPNITELPYDCSGTVTLDAGAGFSTYLWSNGLATQTISATADGNFSVTVTEAGGCSGTATAAVVIPVAPVVSIAGDGQICAGETTVLTATAGFSSYLWSNGQVGNIISTGTAGSISVTVTDAVGCTASANFTLNISPAPQPSITGPNSFCTNSSAILGVNAPFSQYLWSNTASTPTITVNTAGDFSVTVTDATGCTGTASQTVSVSNSLSPTIALLPYDCDGSQSLDAGAGFSSYNWSNSASGQVVSTNLGGTYTVTVADATGCTGTASLAVNVPPAPTVSISGNNSFCGNSGSILTATGGFLSYLWSNGEISDAISVNIGGDFSVTATDNLGCTVSKIFTVTANPTPQPTILGPNSICTGNSAAFSTTQSFTNYLWSNAAVTPTISVDQPGNFSVTVTDANGCTGIDDINLTVNSSLTPMIFALPYNCDGQITLDAGAGFQNYLWGNSFSTQTITVSQSGTYAVTVSDASGCTGTNSTQIIVPQTGQVAITGINQFCLGSSTNLSASPGFSTYLWSNGDSSPAITVNQTGPISVTATDAAGCTSTAQVVVSTFIQAIPAITGPIAACPGNPAILSVPGPFTDYIWSNGATTQSTTVQPPVSVTVTITDGNGCTATSSATVGVSNQLSINIVELPYACGGQITLDAGAGFQNYLWGNGAASQTITVSQSGTYAVTVSDGGGCSGTATAAVQIPISPKVEIIGIENFCAGGSTDLSATAGFQNYLWSNGSNFQTITVDQSGNFGVTVSDANGCTATDDILVSENAPFQVQMLGSTTICNGNPTTIYLASTYQNYLWSDGSTGKELTTATIGTISVTVTDFAGCTASSSVVLTAGGNLTPQIIQVSNDCSGYVVLSPGVGFTSYLWNTGSTNAALLTNQTGNYSVTVSDATGCTGSADFFAQVPQQFFVEISGNTNFCPGGSTQLSATAGFFNYVWSNGSNALTINALNPGTYSVTVSDVIGCTATASATVQQYLPPVPVLQTNEVFCDGAEITINSTGNFVKYEWSDGSSSPFLTVAQIGNYGLTVTDLNGCTGSADIDILAVPPASVTISGNPFFCENDATVLTVVGSLGNYLWSNGLTGSQISASVAGNYAVTVTDANGCTAENLIEIFEKPIATTLIEQVSCRPSEVGETVFALQTTFGCDSLVTVKTSLQATNPGLQLDLPGELTANFGQQIGFDVAGNFPIDSVAFASVFALSCGDCLSPTLIPTESGAILVTAFDADGCPVIGEVLVKINQKFNIFVPNVINFENGTSGNFTVFASPEISFVRNFNVYDRWGEALFSRDEMPTNDPSAGWDGLFREKAAAPGVYVYWFEAVLPNGSVQVFKGDLTVVR